MLSLAEEGQWLGVRAGFGENWFLTSKYLSF